MSIVDAVASVGQAVPASAAAPAESSGQATLGYDAFLKLLVTQMQNQDPLEPMSSSDYVAQLATFSQVEKTVSMNERLGELLSSVRLQQAESVVGRTLSTADGALSGVVASARVVGADVVAILEDGREIVVGPGLTVSGARS